jgi:hypothetical protein
MLDSTHYSDMAGDHLIRAAHAWIPDAGGIPRLHFVEAEILNAPSVDDCRATARVLMPDFEWIEILSKPTAEWRHLVPAPTGRENGSRYPLDHLVVRVLNDAFSVLVQAQGAAVQPAHPARQDAKDLWDFQ